LVQTVYPLSENTGLALTTAKYYTPSGRLIQRDYSGISLYDYYYNREDEAAAAPNGAAPAPPPPNNHEVKLTDSGRTVYGGGGITPDVKIVTPKSTPFQDRLVLKYAFFNFAKHYTTGRHIQKNFEVDENVMQEFRRFLDAQKIPFTEAELAESNEWVRSNIKAELFISEFGQQEGMKVRAETDPNVVKALDLLPKAKELADNARRVVADKQNARMVNQ
jgi:carboxyl-terminal processing protease